MPKVIRISALLDARSRLARVFSMAKIQSFDAKFTPTILTAPHPNLYYENDDLSFLYLLPVLYLLLYACVHWRREAADLRIS